MAKPVVWEAIKIVGDSNTHEYACSSCGVLAGACYEIAKQKPKSNFCKNKEKRKLAGYEEKDVLSKVVLE